MEHDKGYIRTNFTVILVAEAQKHVNGGMRNFFSCTYVVICRWKTVKYTHASDETNNVRVVAWFDVEITYQNIWHPAQGKIIQNRGVQ